MKSRTRGRDDIKVFMTDLRSADETAGGKAVSPPDRIEEHPQTGTPAANRTAQIRTATAIVPAALSVKTISSLTARIAPNQTLRPPRTRC